MKVNVVDRSERLKHLTEIVIGEVEIERADIEAGVAVGVVGTASSVCGPVRVERSPQRSGTPRAFASSL